MIRKKANVDLVTKLRTIVLTEADFNYCNKVLGKTTLEHAERNNLLPKSNTEAEKDIIQLTMQSINVLHMILCDKVGDQEHFAQTMQNPALTEWFTQLLC